METQVHWLNRELPTTTHDAAGSSRRMLLSDTRHAAHFGITRLEDGSFLGYQKGPSLDRTCVSLTSSPGSHKTARNGRNGRSGRNLSPWLADEIKSAEIQL